MLKVRLAATLLVAAFLSGCAAHETDRTTMAASADNSQLNPLGQANMEMKTLRPQAPSELTVTDVRIGLSLIHISEPTRHFKRSRMPSSA